MPDNIQWGFFSSTEYHRAAEVAANTYGPSQSLKDTYYKDFNGKWVRVTAVFDCIEKARKTYRMSDAVYLGAVLINTKTEVPRGSAFPPVEKPTTVSTEEQIKKLIRKKQKVSNIFDEFDGYKYRYFTDETW